jgi:D-alanyl-D-alanine carboxypeptidase
MTITPREALFWGKENLKPVAKPGEKHFYTDTNYYLLGFIIENITRRPFHEALHKYILTPWV